MEKWAQSNLYLELVPIIWHKIWINELKSQNTRHQSHITYDVPILDVPSFPLDFFLYVCFFSFLYPPFLRMFCISQNLLQWIVFFMLISAIVWYFLLVMRIRVLVDSNDLEVHGLLCWLTHMYLDGYWLSFLQLPLNQMKLRV